MQIEYNYVIVDDSEIDQMILKCYLREHSFLGKATVFSSPKACLNYFERNKTDILFLDIEMPQMTGVELLEQVKDKTKCAVFITSHPDFALDGFQLSAADYILKPITKERINETLKRVRNILDNQQKASLYEKGFSGNKITLKSGNGQVQVDAMDIVFLEAMKDYTKVMLQNKKTIIVHGNLATTLRNEHFTDFMRIHKSYAVRPQSVQEIKTKELVLNTDDIVPLGKEYRKELVSRLESL